MAWGLHPGTLEIICRPSNKLLLSSNGAFEMETCDARQLIIDRIEGCIGSLLSMPWNELSSKDLHKIGLAILMSHNPRMTFPLLNALNTLKES